MNALRKQFPDARVLPTAGDLPKPTGIPGVPTKDIGGRLAPVKKSVWLAKGLLHSLRPHDPAHHETPQANLTPLEARWFSLSRVDGATVTTADGRGVVYRQRDREQAKALLAESRALQKQVADRFDEMRRRYRDAHPEPDEPEEVGRCLRAAVAAPPAAARVDDAVTVDADDKTVTIPPAAGEVALLMAIQDTLTDAPGVLPVAKVMSSSVNTPPGGWGWPPSVRWSTPTGAAAGPPSARRRSRRTRRRSSSSAWCAGAARITRGSGWAWARRRS